MAPQPVAPPAPPLPGLELGRGERRDECRHYPECISAFVEEHARGRRQDPSARCPKGCEAFETIPVHARMEAAVRRDGSVLGLGVW